MFLLLLLSDAMSWREIRDFNFWPFSTDVAVRSTAPLEDG